MEVLTVDTRRPVADDTERLRVQVLQLKSHLNQMDTAIGSWRDAKGTDAGSVWAGLQTLAR